MLCSLTLGLTETIFMVVWAPVALHNRTRGWVRVTRVGGPWGIWQSLSMRTLAELLAALCLSTYTTFGSVIFLPTRRVTGGRVLVLSTCFLYWAPTRVA